MKKSTYEKRAKIANDVMNYIYKYIDTRATCKFKSNQVTSFLL